MSHYTPNFNDPRVQERLRLVLGWCRFNLSPTKPQAWHVGALEKVFGTGSNQLSAYLRKHLLQEERSSYAYRNAQGKLIVRGTYEGFFDRVGTEDEFLDAGSCKTYLRNQDGYLYLLSRVKDISPTTNLSQHATHKGISPIHQVEDRLGVAAVMKKHGAQVEAGRFEYNETASGRLTHPLQQVIRDNKPDLWRLLGYRFDYDIVTCAPTLLLQYARRAGFTKPTPEYDAYLRDRRAYRNSLAGVLNVSAEVSKVLITALFNGARLSTSRKEALMKRLNKEVKEGRLQTPAREVITQLKGVDFITRLRKDIASLWSFIREKDYPNQPKVPIYRKKQSNPNLSQHATHKGISPIQVSSTGREVWYHRKKSLNGSQRWSIYLRLERRVLNAVRPVLESRGRVFLEHDGWRTDFDMRTDVLSHVIYQLTGYSVIIEKEEL